MILFTSDTHFYHKNVILYCNRPFNSIDEMNEALIENWNRRVSPSDTIYHLGDFAFAKPNKIEGILQRLNGKKVLIMGNHDRCMRDLHSYFEYVTNYHELRVDDKMFVLSHYPFARWNKGHHGSFMLHGHEHGSYKTYGRILDVGVDNCNYAPITLDEVVDKLKYEPHTAHHHNGENDE